MAGEPVTLDEWREKLAMEATDMYNRVERLILEVDPNTNADIRGHWAFNAVCGVTSALANLCARLNIERQRNSGTEQAPAGT